MRRASSAVIVALLSLGLGACSASQITDSEGVSVCMSTEGRDFGATQAPGVAGGVITNDSTRDFVVLAAGANSQMNVGGVRYAITAEEFEEEQSLEGYVIGPGASAMLLVRLTPQDWEMDASLGGIYVTGEQGSTQVDVLVLDEVRFSPYSCD